MRKSQNERYLDALHRAQEEGGDDPAAVLTRGHVSVSIADVVFAVVQHTGGKPEVEQITVKHELDVKVIQPEKLAEVGQVSVRRSGGGEPEKTPLLFSNGKYWWDYKIVDGADELIREEVLSAVDRAAEQRAWRAHAAKPHLQDCYAEDYLSQLPHAFDGLFAFGAIHRNLYVGSHKPEYVMSVRDRNHTVSAHLEDSVRLDMPHYPAIPTEDWKCALFRFALAEIDILDALLSDVAANEPDVYNKVFSDTLDQEHLNGLQQDTYRACGTYYQAEQALFRALRTAKIITTKNAEPLKGMPSIFDNPLASKRYKNRAPYLAAFADQIEQSEADKLNELCEANSWPFAMSPLRFLQKRAEGFDRHALRLKEAKATKSAQGLDA